MEKQILHIDVNNAFLSWTALDMLRNGYNLDIRTIPSVIGGDENRRAGVVLAKSVEAKKFGILTGETLYQARKKCPDLQVFSANHKVYAEFSNKLYYLLLNYTDKIERYSIDECFLDMTEYLMNNSIMNIAEDIRNRVKEELGFTVNIGISNNKVLAKMASDFLKPDKIHTLYKDEIKEKMWLLPVNELFMLGKNTAQKLYNMQIKTIGELANTNVEILTKKFGKHGKQIWEYANGIDDSEVDYSIKKPKGIGNSITLPEDIVIKEELEKVLYMLTEQVTYRLRKEKMYAKVVNVQLRTSNFQDFSHQRKLEKETSNTSEIYKQAKLLLDEMYTSNIPIRLIGLRVDKLVEFKDKQISLFDEMLENKKQEHIDNVIDNVKDKYGYGIITRAGALNTNELLKRKFNT